MKAAKIKVTLMKSVIGTTEDHRACVRGLGLKRRHHSVEVIDTPAVPAGGEDAAAELKRLRRENEILRQEREILKRATTFFAKEGSR